MRLTRSSNAYGDVKNYGEGDHDCLTFVSVLWDLCGSGSSVGNVSSARLNYDGASDGRSEVCVMISCRLPIPDSSRVVLHCYCVKRSWGKSMC